jgi:serine protease Do
MHGLNVPRCGVNRILTTALVFSTLVAAAAGQAPKPQAGAAAVPPAASPAAASDRASIDRAIAAVLPSLVRLTVVYLDQQGGREVKGQLSGSGTIISADGYVVTNHHVAGRPRRIVCTLSTREEIPADLIGTDPLSDIAVVKLHPDTPRTFPFARFGDSDALKRGQSVLAMGSPLALSQSVTLGIVSNKEMIMPPSFGGEDRLDGEDVGMIVRWIGHDAAIYPGNSGGPLVSLAGEIVGVNEISFGLGGAIPSNLANAVAKLLIRDGRVRRSWTGVEVQPRIGNGPTTGALVSWVADKSPAAAGGVRPGDILLKVNESPVDAKYAEQVPIVNQVLLGLAIGQPSAFVVRRDGKDLTLPVIPVERPAAISTPAEEKDWGFTVANLTPVEARELGRDSTEGVRVVSLRPNGPADQAKPQLRPSDILVEVDGKPLKKVADLESATQATLAAGKRSKVLVTFERDHDRQLTVVEIGEVAKDDPPRDAKKAWVPVGVQVLTPPLAEKLGLKGRTGVRVTRLLDGRTPLRVGDIVLAIEGDPVRATAQNDEDIFATTIRRYKSGQSVTLTVYREGKEMPLPVVLMDSPTKASEMKFYDDKIFEFRARDIAEVDRLDPQFKDVAGAVLVESVAARGWASLGRLNGGDLILTIDGRPVKGIDDFIATMNTIETRKPASIVFEIQRGIRTLFVEIQPTWK